VAQRRGAERQQTLAHLAPCGVEVRNGQLIALLAPTAAVSNTLTSALDIDCVAPFAVSAPRWHSLLLRQAGLPGAACGRYVRAASMAGGPSA
jgi:hypothetical protein